MAEIKLQTTLTAKDEASEKIKGLNLSFGKMVSAIGIGTLAANAFTKATDFVTDAIKGSIEAAKAEEVATAKVNSILKTLSGNLEDHKKIVDAAANSAMKLGFDDEDAAISMAKLLQTTKDSTTANKAMQDAMDLARFKGIGLEESTQAINLAMMGNTKILKQLGIDVPDHASKLEILGLVQDKVAGQAEAFGNTAAGAQEKLAVQIENVKEKFGAALNKGITPFVNKLSEWISKPETQQFITQLADALGKVLTVLGDLVIKALPKMMQFFKDMIGGWKELKQIIKDTADALDRFFTNLNNNITAKSGSTVGNFFDKLKGGLGGISNLVTTGKLEGHATGGFVQAGRPIMVGEQGSEMFVPASSGKIMRHDQMGGSVEINFNNPVVRNDSDLQTIIEVVKQSISRDLRLVKTGAF